MASTYSSSLNLELQTTGENSGSWGTKTNNNLQKLESAIKGYVSVAVASTSDSLTASDGGTTDEQSNAIIKLTGTTQKVIYKELPMDDPKKRRPDITKAKSILGWEPKVSRQEGLKITYDFFKSLSNKELSEVDHYNFDKFIK